MDFEFQYTPNHPTLIKLLQLFSKNMSFQRFTIDEELRSGLLGDNEFI